MENNSSEIAYDSFHKEWGNQFNDILHIIEYMHSNPLILEKLKLNNLCSPSELIKNQQEWVWLLTKYDGIEKDFFKPFWVPILNNSLGQVFFDLSNFNYPLFHVEYLGLQPDIYEKINLVKSIQELLTFKDNALVLEDIYLNYLDKRDELISNYCLPKPECSNVFGPKYIIIIEIGLEGFIFESTLQQSNLDLYILYVFFQRQNYDLDNMHELDNMHLIEEYSINEDGRYYTNDLLTGGASNGHVTVSYITLESGFCIKTYLKERAEYINIDEEEEEENQCP